MFQRTIYILCLALSCASANAQWDSVTTNVATIGETDEHWFTVRGRGTGFIIDGDAGEVKGTLVLSDFTTALRPLMSQNKIFAYGSYYTRDYYGEREDVVLVFDASTTSPILEIPIPPSAAGLGHSGAISLLKDKYLAVWNITPATSISMVDIESNEYIGEISLPGCAFVYAIEDGFIMPCGDGTVQYLEVGDDGTETGRTRTEPFFNVMEDPILDYAVPTADGWMFISMDGLVYEVTVDNGRVSVTDPWTINPESNGIADINGVKRADDDDWRLSGSQPFTYSAANEELFVLMHKGGGQETFEDPATEVWAFSTRTQRRGYRLVAEEGETFRSIQITQDEDPILIVGGSAGIEIFQPTSGKKLREIDVNSGLIQNLYD